MRDYFINSIMTILENYLKSKKVQKTLATKPGEDGFSLVELVVVIAVLAILSAVAIPAFVGVQANARASAVKNGMANGVKECVIRAADNQTVAPQTVVQSFPGNYTGYAITVMNGQTNNCYNAYATASNPGDSNFSIIMNPATGQVTKACTVASAPGCSADGDW